MEASKRMEAPEFSRRLGQLLRIRRGDRSQIDVSGAAGISDSAYSNYERGKVIPSLETLAKLFEVLGISAAELVALLDEPNGRAAA